MREDMLIKIVNNYQVNLLHARHCSKHFPGTLSFNHHCNVVR